MSANSIDPEKGLITSTSQPVDPSWVSSAPRDADHSLAHSPLQLFQLLVGIHTPPSLVEDAEETGQKSKTKCKRSRSDNVGLYQRAKQQEHQARIQYQITSFISNSLFMIQILLAATFTAMSAYKESHPVTLTVLGAANTVIAGCLAWQKGQGVPQRYRKAMDQYQALIFEIEMSERSFVDVESSQGENGFKLDPRAEKVRLQKQFDTARADQQANYPDLYVSTGVAAAKEQKDLLQQIEDAKAEAATVQSEMMARIQALVTALEGKVDAHAKAATQIA